MVFSNCFLYTLIKAHYLNGDFSNPHFLNELSINMIKFIRINYDII